MMNHGQAPSQFLFDRSTHCIKVSHAEGIAPGEQVQLFYGERSAAEYLADYGFVPEVSPIELIEIPGAIPTTDDATVAVGTPAAFSVAARRLVQRLGLGEKAAVYPDGPSSDLMAALRLLTVDRLSLQRIEEAATNDDILREIAGYPIDTQSELRAVALVKSLCGRFAQKIKSQTITTNPRVFRVQEELIAARARTIQCCLESIATYEESLRNAN
jgi:hypothetical protein